MTFLAFAILGVTSLVNTPIILMPEIDVPNLKIKINEPNYSSNELESLIVKPIRKQLLQVSNLEDLDSKTSNGMAIIDVIFEHGVDLDYAFIEVNDNLDKVMSSLPKEANRPILIKSSSSDIPLLFVNIPYPKNESRVDFSSYINDVVKKRLEQNKSISYIDITGVYSPQIVINPKVNTLERLNISIKDIEKTINKNNSTLGSFKIKDGHYILDVLFEPTISDVESIKNLYIVTKKGSFQLKEVAKVSLGSRDRKGLFYNNRKEALSLAVYSKKSSKIHDTKKEVINYLEKLKEENQKLSYSISEDQTNLLKISINNLVNSMFTGVFLAVFIVFVFIREPKLALIIGVVIPISLVISFLFLKLLGITINIVSLSGLIVGIGMMIDNSLIVIDNITQYQVKENSFLDSCSKGVYEVIKPLLSSLLTTCAVFLPLIYLSGIPGVLFYDQAVTIIVSLTVSYLTSIILLPTLFTFLKINVKKQRSSILQKIYLYSFDFLFGRKKTVIFLGLIIFILGLFLSVKIDKQKLPNIRYDNFDLFINWNESIGTKDNLSRTIEVSKQINASSAKYIGEQDYLAPVKGYLSTNESSMFIQTKSYNESQKMKKKIKHFLHTKYKNSIFKISNSKNLFEQLFPKEEVNLLAIIPNDIDEYILEGLIQEINEKFPLTKIKIDNKVDYIKIEIDINKLLLYKVDLEVLLSKLYSFLGSNKISVLKTTNQYLPIFIKNKEDDILLTINSLYVNSRESVKVPIKSIISLKKQRQRQNIYANTYTDYIPLIIDTKNEEEVISLIKSKIGKDLKFKGKYFEDKDFIKELSIILIIVICLLYFILAAQFESLRQPLIILSEIPITLGMTIIILYFMGFTLNIMSMTGLIIVLGIIINDSILKVDAINKSRYLFGMSIMEAIHSAGKKRLNAILMTSLTTIFAMTPIFFTSGIGYDLQKPLAVVVITSMLIGTIVSIYYVPIIYWFLTKKKNNEI